MATDEMKNNGRNRIAARSVGATMILLSVFMTWLFVPSPGAVLFPLWLVGLLGWVGILNVILGGNPIVGISGADPLVAVLVVIFAAFSLTLVVAGGIMALIPTKIATKIGRRSKSVSIGGGILSLIGVGLFAGFLQVNIFSLSSLTYGLGFYVAILGSILAIASAAIPKEKKVLAAAIPKEKEEEEPTNKIVEGGPYGVVSEETVGADK